MKKILIPFIAGLMMLFAGHAAMAQAPTLINFQGKLTDSFEAPVDTDVIVKFSIYDNETVGSGTELWAEEHPVVNVAKGMFNVLLGSGTLLTALPIDGSDPLGSIFTTGEDRWLQIEVNNDGPMDIRQRIVSVAYSMHADNADLADSAIAADDVPGKDINPQSVSIWGAGEVINSLGEWTGSQIATSKITEDDPQVGANSTNRIPKWNGSALVGSSSINENATGNVGIGTASPGSKLEVAGDTKINGVLSSGKIQVVDVVAENSSCSSNGLVARSSSGLLLSCQSGVWAKASGGGGTVSRGACYWTTPTTWTSDQCANGYFVTQVALEQLGHGWNNIKSRCCKLIVN